MSARRSGNRAAAWGVAVAFVAMGAGLGAWRWRVDRARSRHEAFAAWIDPVARAEGCLFGVDAPPADARALQWHLRRLALSADARERWPERCVTGLAGAGVRAAGLPALAAALHDETARVAALRMDGAEASLGQWVSAWDAVRAQVSQGLAAEGLALRPASLAEAPSLRSAEASEELPVEVPPESALAGVSRGDGVLSMLWVDPQRGRVLCRTRDGGASMRCRRYPAPGAAGGVVALVPNDRAEALLLVDDGTGGYAVASADDLQAPLFSLQGAPLHSLPLRVHHDVLSAITQRGGAVSFEQVQRRQEGGRRARRPRRRGRA